MIEINNEMIPILTSNSGRVNARADPRALIAVAL